jgi:hypothetical protein
VFEDAEDCLRDIVHNHIKVDFIRFVSLGVESMFKGDYVGVVHLLHNLQFSILISLVLVYFLYSHLFIVLIDCGLENHSERPITNYSFSIVSETG